MSTSTSRRAFLARSAALSMLGSTAAPFAVNLASMGAASAQSLPSPPDYKALVCVFLLGANDHFNTLLATDPASWAAYNAIRATGGAAPINLPAVGQPGGVLPITVADPLRMHVGRSFALHPALGELRTLFEAGRVAVVPNVGPLLRPMSKAQWTANSVPRPSNLFSHNDQQATWQAAAPEDSARMGWGGRLGDLFLASNAGGATFTCISATGNAVWLAGQSAVQYQVGNNGATAIQGLTGQGGAQMAQIIQDTSATHLFERELAVVTRRSIEAQRQLSGAMAGNATGAFGTLPVPAGNGLANSLRAVARIIAGRQTLGVRRQVFFVALGGWDTHNTQVATQGALLAQVSAAFKHFDDLMGGMGLREQVTVFTASDFGRTFTSNGDGTDHGWGSYHFVMGGAVQGGQIHGRFPVLGVNTPDDVGQGRLLPQFSVEQYAAPLTRWMGLDAGLQDLVLPNLRYFDRNALGSIMRS